MNRDNNSINEQQNNGNDRNAEQQAVNERENNRIHLKISGVYEPTQRCGVKFGCSFEGTENNAQTASCCGIF